MIVEPFDLWWCCLNQRERSTIQALVPLWITNPTYVERSIFDVIVTVTGEASSIKMLEFFMLHYGLEYQDIPCGEDCVIHAVVFDPVLWAALALFSFTDKYICAVPCKLLTFPL